MHSGRSKHRCLGKQVDVPKRTDRKGASEAARTSNDIDVEIDGPEPVECVEKDTVSRTNHNAVIPTTARSPICFLEQGHIGAICASPATVTCGGPCRLNHEHVLGAATRCDDDVIAFAELCHATVIIEQQMNTCGVRSAWVAKEIVDIDKM